MERPRGVTVLAYLYLLLALLVAFSSLLLFVPSRTSPPIRAFNPLQHQRLLAQLVAFLIVAVTLGIALLRMKPWSRWLAITVSAVQLLSVLYEVAVTHSSTAAGAGSLGLRTLFAVWVIWYLTRTHVKTAFQSA